MEEIKYNVVFARRRSISIIVRPDKSVTVRAPLRMPLSTIEKFVKSKSSWIKKHIDSDPSIKLSNNGKKYTGGEVHLYLGKEYILRKIVSSDPFVKLNESSIEVGQIDIADNLRTKYLVESWYIRKALEVLSEKVKEILRKYNEYGFRPTGFVIRPMKTRWGTCTSKAKITLNSELVKLDQIFIEYVIIHELCHLKVPTHGADFYRLLAEIIPDYKSIRKEMRKYTTK